jgi:flagellar hook-associated protein 2
LMSDISIPGVRSKYKSDQLVKDLVEVEKIPLKRMQESEKKLQSQKNSWREINASLTRLRESARTLFSFQNPFSERVVASSNEKAVSGTATREALESTGSLRIIRIAQADKLLSRPLADDFPVVEGKYVFKSGDKETSFSFKGGKLSDFVKAINEKAGELVKAQLVRSGDNAQVLVVEGLKTGIANRLEFSGETPNLLEKAGLMERSIENTRTIRLDRASLQDWTRSDGLTAVSAREGGLRFAPGAEAVIQVSPAFPVREGMLLEMEVRVTRQQAKPWSPPPAPPGPAVPVPPAASLGDVTVKSISSRAVLPEWKQPEAPKLVDDPSMIFVGDGGKPVALPPLNDSAEFVKVQYPVKDYVGSVAALYVRNNNSFRDLDIRSLRIYDPNARGDYKPTNAISMASDAQLEIDGVPVQRSSNTIDNLIPGVTLNLRATSPDPIELKVEPDRKMAKDVIIKFIGQYNQIMRDVNIMTRNDPTLISELEYLNDDEKKKATEKLGVFQGDLSLNQVKTSLQGIMMNAYQTSSGRDVSMLAQLGISTNARSGAGRPETTKLRGYLEIDESRLDASLRNKMPAIKELFGRDSDGDRVIDSGVAFALDAYLRPYVQTGGLISSRIGTIDSEIGRTGKRIQDYNNYLVKYESDLKRKYGMMESSLNSLEKNSRAIENFNRSGDNGR